MRKRSLTARDRRIIKKRFEGKTIREIAREEGIYPNSVFLVLKRVQPQLKETLRLSDHGLYRAVRDMVELTEAKKIEYFAHKGSVRDKRVVNDNAIQFAARREMLRVHGFGVRSNRESGKKADDAATIVVDLSFLSPERQRQVLPESRGTDAESESHPRTLA